MHYCESCEFIQINDPIAPEMLDTEYNYCFSAWKRQPHISVEMELLNKHIKDKSIKILEIGCNDGVFLEPLRQAGCINVVGTGANPYAAKGATAYELDILNKMFDEHSAEEIKEQYGYIDMVVMRQVLEHIPDLNNFFKALDSILDGEKLLFIEVPDFEEALKSGDCSTIWEEHPNYFTYEVLELMLNKKGYVILDKAFYDFSGGAICVLAKKVDMPIESALKSNMLQYKNFANVVNDYSIKLKSALDNAHKRGAKIFLYGTGSRACTLVNGLELGEKIDYAIDDQKEKQGHYMPGSHLPIISLDEIDDVAGQDNVFLLAVNHENEEIVANEIVTLHNRDNVKIVSLFAPNDIFDQVQKI